jgi:hypothetical protein
LVPKNQRFFQVFSSPGSTGENARTPQDLGDEELEEFALDLMAWLSRFGEALDGCWGIPTSPPWYHGCETRHFNANSHGLMVKLLWAYEMSWWNSHDTMVVMAYDLDDKSWG